MKLARNAKVGALAAEEVAVDTVVVMAAEAVAAAVDSAVAAVDAAVGEAAAAIAVTAVDMEAEDEIANQYFRLDF